jgi:hypothetical protein
MDSGTAIFITTMLYIIIDYYSCLERRREEDIKKNEINDIELESIDENEATNRNLVSFSPDKYKFANAC